MIFDTQARVSVGVNENDATETGLMIEAIALLSAAAEGTAMLVHHTGHDGDRSRGSSAAFGALDFELHVRKAQRMGILVDVTKQKNAEELKGLKLGLVGVQDTNSLAVTTMGELISPEDIDEMLDFAELGLTPNEGRPAEAIKLRTLASFMARNALPGGAGRTRNEVFEALRYSTKDDRTAKRAWDELLRRGAIEYVRGAAGPCRYVEPSAR
jgi:hypothetical protein